MTAKRNSNGASHTDDAVRFERGLLSCVLEHPELLQEVRADLLSEHFLISDHRILWNTMLKLQTFDFPILAAAVSDKVDPAVIAGLYEPGFITANYKTYARHVRADSLDRQFARLQERLSQSLNGDRREIVQQMLKVIDSNTDGQDWRSIFHTLEEFETATPFSFAISGFLPCEGITLIGGLAEHGKTFAMLSMTRSLLTGEPLFGWAPLSVAEIANRVVYLVPENAIGPFWKRIMMFRLENFIRDGRLLVRTLSHREQYVELDDPRILRAAEGAHVFLDTATRFMNGGEDVENVRAFANTLFEIVAAGARSVTGAHHAPKGFEEAKYMTLENIVRGSGDLGAMLSAGWGLRRIDKQRNAIFVGNIKSRDFEACGSFVIEGRPHLDERGSFAMVETPGQARPLREYLEEAKDPGGRPRENDDAVMMQAAELRQQGKSLRESERILGVKKSTIQRLLWRYDSKKDTVQ